MNKTLIPALVIVLAVVGFYLIFGSKEDSPAPLEKAVRAKPLVEGRLGAGKVPDKLQTPDKEDRKKLPTAAPVTLTPEQQAAEAARLATIAVARAAFEAAVADNVASAVASSEFMAGNGEGENVSTTATGLQFQVISKGEGPLPVATDMVKVHYHGTLPDGTVFDSSVDRGEPAVFPLSRVIAGWTEGLQLMPLGSNFKLFIPPYLAYGANGAGQAISPHAALIFDITLLGIEN